MLFRSKVPGLAKANSSLVRLQGSPKQVAWAETLRASGIEAIRNIIVQIPETESEELRAALATAAERVSNVTSATWWIDRRNHGMFTGRWTYQNLSLFFAFGTINPGKDHPLINASKSDAFAAISNYKPDLT